MLTYVITDLPPQLSTFRTAYPMKCSQNLSQMHFWPSLKATVKHSSVKGIMDHHCLFQGTWHGHHIAQVQQSIGIEGILTACCIL